jgi:uncharacterized protein (DUF1778 family)
MKNFKKKIASNNANVRKHCLFRSNEITLIKEAADIAKVSFSHFVRKSAIHAAESVTGRRIAPL